MANTTIDSNAFAMSNEELKTAIAVAFDMSHKVGSLHGSYGQVNRHLQTLLEIQQRRAAFVNAVIEGHHD